MISPHYFSSGSGSHSNFKPIIISTDCCLSFHFVSIASIPNVQHFQHNKPRWHWPLPDFSSPSISVSGYPSPVSDVYNFNDHLPHPANAISMAILFFLTHKTLHKLFLEHLALPILGSMPSQVRDLMFNTIASFLSKLQFPILPCGSLYSCLLYTSRCV